MSLATAVKAHPACSPSDRLMKVLHLGLREEEGRELISSYLLLLFTLFQLEAQFVIFIEAKKHVVIVT